MTTALSGKWVWLWNWRRCDGGDPAKVAARLRAAGCRGAIIKAHDGPHWFDQGRPWREIAAGLKSEGLAVGAWAYLYGRDPAGESRLAGETASYGEADLFVLDVEAEFEGRPEPAQELCRRVREAVGHGYPLYYSSFAIARYHRSFPYASFDEQCQGAAPQVYWNAFRWPVAQSVRWTYEDYAAQATPPERLFPVAGLYSGRGIPYPTPADVAAFAAQAAAGGSTGVSFWSYEHMNDEMWETVRAVKMEEEPMPSLEFQQLSAAHAALAGRVARLEKDVAALRSRSTAPPGGGPRAPARRRTYTVRAGDTLSEIAAGLGMSDWRPLYEANRGVIGPDPDLIRPGQVLTVPQ